MNNIGIKLHLVQFLNVNLNINSFNVEVTDNLQSDKFAITTLHNEADSNAFGIQFDLNLSHGEDFNLNIRAIAHFLTDSPYDRDFLDSDFTKVNAPAIAFPYIRTYISNLTLNSGYNPVILPPYNFVEMNKIKEAEKSKAQKKASSSKAKKVQKI